MAHPLKMCKKVPKSAIFVQKSAKNAQKGGPFFFQKVGQKWPTLGKIGFLYDLNSIFVHQKRLSLRPDF